MRLATLDPGRLAAERRQRGLVAAFDLDGTLAPIAKTPAGARVPASLRRSILKLARRPDTTVGIVSGRPLAEVARMAGGPGLYLAGIHGWERRAPGGRRERLWTARELGLARTLARRLERGAAAIPGVCIERKGPVVALHDRAATPEGRRQARRLARALRPPGYDAVVGRRVVEIRPAGGPTKADAVRWVAASRPGGAILYAGDDTTDEDAFAALRREDFPVRVGGAEARGEMWRDGRRGSKARYVLKGPTEVARIVSLLAMGEALRIRPALRRKRPRA